MATILITSKRTMDNGQLILHTICFALLSLQNRIIILYIMKYIYMLMIEQQMIYLSYLIVHCPLSTTSTFAMAHASYRIYRPLKMDFFLLHPLKIFHPFTKKILITNGFFKPSISNYISFTL